MYAQQGRAGRDVFTKLVMSKAQQSRTDAPKQGEGRVGWRRGGGFRGRGWGRSEKGEVIVLMANVC